MATILIVDDRAINREFLASLLGHSGYRTAEAADGAQALDIARADRPDLIIADVIMPVMDGVELARRLHADPATAGIPVIFYTATFRMGEATSLAKTCGVTEMLAKPSEPLAILEAVGRALGVTGTSRQPAAQVVEPLALGLLAGSRSPGLAGLERQLLQADERLSIGGQRGIQALGMRLATLLELGLSLAGERDPGRLLKLACRGAQEIMSVAQVAIGMEDRAGRLQHLETIGFASNAQTLVGSPDSAVERLADFHPPGTHSLQAEIASANRSHGWLYLAGRLGGTRFAAEDEQIAATLAAQLGMAWENLALYDELSQSHQAILEREERLAGMIDSAMDAIITTDENQRIVIFNAAAEKMFRCRREEMLGQPLDRLIPERFRQIHRDHVERFGLTGVTGRRMGAMLAICGLRADGLEFPIEASISQVGEGERKVYTVILRDITDRQQAEAALIKARDELEARVQERTCELQESNCSLQKEIHERQRAEAELRRSNAELEEFAHTTSHDLQEPLRTVAGFVQLLAGKYRGRLDADADRYISLALDGVKRMQLTIKDVLAYAKVQGSRGAGGGPADSAAALREALANLQQAIAEADARVTYDRLPQVAVPAGQLSQLFQNLVGNALKFRGTEALRVHVSAHPDGEYWRFSVQDNGIGIDPAYHDRIFGMFQRLHSRQAYPGSGIGLALCKKIVECHGGRIWVDSIRGEGSAFHFTLPRSGGVEAAA